MELPTERLAELPRRRPVGTVLLAVLACIPVGASESIFTAAGLEAWYGTLEKPALAPPNWEFGPVWTVLFALMGSLSGSSGARPRGRTPAPRDSRSGCSSSTSR